MDYDGPKTCQAAKLFYNGRTSCNFACLGYGDCVNACEYDAIKIEIFRAIIDPDKCTACGACVDVCPKDCITLYSSEPRRMQA